MLDGRRDEAGVAARSSSDRPDRGPGDIFDKIAGPRCVLRCASISAISDVAAAQQGVVLVSRRRRFSASFPEWRSHWFDLGRRITDSVIHIRVPRSRRSHGYQLTARRSDHRLRLHLRILRPSALRSADVLSPIRSRRGDARRAASRQIRCCSIRNVVCLWSPPPTQGTDDCRRVRSDEAVGFFITGRAASCETTSLALLTKADAEPPWTSPARRTSGLLRARQAPRRIAYGRPRRREPQSVEHQAFDTVRQVAELSRPLPPAHVNTRRRKGCRD